MKLQRWVVVIVVVVTGAYCVHGVVTETGVAGWLMLGGRRWTPTFWAYDLTPEARYEYFITLRTAGVAARGIRADDAKKAEDGWRQECPFCEIFTRAIGDERPQCGRRLIFTLGRPPLRIELEA